MKCGQILKMMNIGREMNERTEQLTEKRRLLTRREENGQKEERRKKISQGILDISFYTSHVFGVKGFWTP